ncbi:endonuclease/exonuclease/phosphatase family protein [Metapseudomonas otitidis]|uniref:endonuclease/exonuclease/phosphatase family protein n=1 Tax=Metapseudomonas otitidis TaxID=319939 RepID=UPI001AAE82AA|nr:endonuclease/exonuclease/phosphatase family protein [Pseudomonas otitidis]MBO2928661.1 endonuclease/exonuclease/phosphatase family protein [Pseudomonas otitidis]MEE1892826.1 endonuclease/exonuclease/phosphatase family protein [Pseudomonas otitidis]
MSLAPGRPLPGLEGAEAVRRLRIITVNTHKGFTALNRRFILPELRDAVRTLGADLVFLQEVLGTHRRHSRRYQDWPPTPQYEFLADSMWGAYAYGRNAVYPDGDHGNALLSKFPILRHENLDVSIAGNEERGLLHSVLEVPGHDEVHAICVHLGLREAHRQQQLALLRDLVVGLPSEAPVIVAGDFNDWRQRADPVLAACGLREAFVETHGAPARSFPARWPLLPLDRVYLRNASAHSPQVLRQRPWSHLSDHAPLLVEVHL